MTSPLKRMLFWAPRLLGILFAVFASVFAFDVFDQGSGFWETVLALLIHLLPAGILLIVVAIAWRWEWVGAVLFSLLAAVFLALSWGQGIGIVNPIAGPLLLLGVLFLINWLFRAELRAGS